MSEDSDPPPMYRRTLATVVRAPVDSAMDAVSLLSEFEPQDAAELTHWLEGLEPSEFEKMWVAAVTLYAHDELERTGEFPLHDLVRIMLAIQERYWKLAGATVIHSWQSRKVVMPRTTPSASSPPRSGGRCRSLP